MNRTIAAYCLLLSAIHYGSPAFATPVVINFDNLVGGTTLTTGDIVTTQYAALGVTFVNPDFPAYANQTNQPLFTGNSPPNTLFVTQHDGFNGAPITIYGRPLQVSFSSPMSDVKMWFATSNSDQITMTAFSQQGEVLDSVRVRGISNDPLDLLPRVGTIELQEPDGIGHVELYSRFGTSSVTDRAENFYIDDLVLTPVPEPSTLVLAALGVATLYLAARVRA